MDGARRKHWEKEAIHISEMMHRGFYEKTIHPKDLDGYLSQGSFSWIGAVEGENYLNKKDAITAFSSSAICRRSRCLRWGKAATACSG